MPDPIETYLDALDIALGRRANRKWKQEYLDEIRSHLQLASRELEQSGMTIESAQEVAAQKLGSPHALAKIALHSRNGERHKSASRLALECIGLAAICLAINFGMFEVGRMASFDFRKSIYMLGSVIMVAPWVLFAVRGFRSQKFFAHAVSGWLAVTVILLLSGFRLINGPSRKFGGPNSSELALAALNSRYPLREFSQLRSFPGSPIDPPNSSTRSITTSDEQAPRIWMVPTIIRGWRFDGFFGTGTIVGRAEALYVRQYFDREKAEVAFAKTLPEVRIVLENQVAERQRMAEFGDFPVGIVRQTIPLLWGFFALAAVNLVSIGASKAMTGRRISGDWSSRA